jgi:hypothetical protein
MLSFAVAPVSSFSPCGLAEFSLLRLRSLAISVLDHVDVLLAPADRSRAFDSASFRAAGRARHAALPVANNPPEIA